MIMYKYIFIGIILSAFSCNSIAQDRNSLAKEITNKMSFMKNGYEKRQIEFKDDSIYGTPFTKIISKGKIEKDSLRHLLVDNGFYDFNFELFEFKIKNLDEFNEAFIKVNTPQLFNLLSDSTFNKITYSYQKLADIIEVSIILSENDIIVDKERNMFDGFMPGAEIHTGTFKAFSLIKDITFCEEKSYSNLTKKGQNKQNKLKLDNSNRFEVTIHFTTNIETKYIGIKDTAGNMLSIIKL